MIKQMEDSIDFRVFIPYDFFILHNMKIFVRLERTNFQFQKKFMTLFKAHEEYVMENMKHHNTIPSYKNLKILLEYI